MMLDMLNTIDFHLLRPWWLIAILPALTLAWFLLKRRTDASGWAAVIDSELLNELLDGQQHAQKKWPMLALLLAWILAACAIAGPCFEKNNQAALKQADAVVILLDLSPSMLAQDVQPSRLQAAHYKILDLLHQRREGYTGLIAYSGSAHVVAPLSDDSNTIAALVSTLTPNIMPSIGSRVEDAVSEALQLLENSHFSRGRILLLTDGAVPEALANIQQQLKGKSVQLDVIGIGTSAGAPISLPGGSFVKDNNGNILMNKLDEATLQKIAQENGGYYSPLRSDDKDIAPLIAPPDWLAQLGNGDARDASHTVENWQDVGYWLALPCALLVLLFFRRGVLICLLPLLFLTHQENVRADNVPANNVPAADVQADSPTAFPKTWQDWWQTPNQQAATALEKNDAATAAKQFTDPQWKAYAEYQNGQHKEAAEHFAESSSANAEYNRGNAQAKAGDLQGALDSYEQSLKQKTDFADAEFNRDLVKKLLDEQKKQQDKNQKQDQKQQDQNQQQDNKQQDQDQKDQQQQNQDQKQQDTQQSDAKNQEKSDAQKSEEEKQAENEQKSEEEKQAEAEKQAQEAKEQQSKDEQEKKSAKPKQPDDKQDPENKDIVRDSEGKSQADKEKQQANEQWLRKVPDDPGGLLKNKFEYYYQLNRQRAARERRAGSSSEEEQRW